MHSPQSGRQTIGKGDPWWGRVGIVPSGCQPVVRLRRAAGTRNSESRQGRQLLAQGVSPGNNQRNFQSPERSEWAAGDEDSPYTPAPAGSCDSSLSIDFSGASGTPRLHYNNMKARATGGTKRRGALPRQFQCSSVLNDRLSALPAYSYCPRILPP